MTTYFRNILKEEIGELFELTILAFRIDCVSVRRIGIYSVKNEMLIPAHKPNGDFSIKKKPNESPTPFLISI